MNDSIRNVFNDFSSYLSVCITLEPIASQKLSEIFMLAAFVVFVYLLPSIIKDWFQFFSSEEH